jgi:hypothetical protein
MLFVASLLFATAASTSALPPLSMTVTHNRITVQGVAPASTVVLYGVGLEPYRYSTRIVESATVIAAVDGTVTYTPSTPIPFRSIWIAVDQQSGAFVVSGRVAYPIQRRLFDESAFRRNQAGEIASLDSAQPELYTLIVRPGSGAWRIFTRDGGTGDADAVADGSVGVLFRQATAIGPVAGSTPPDYLVDGDVVALIDPLHMDIAARQLGNPLSDLAGDAR